MFENERFLAVGIPKQCTHDLGHGLNESGSNTCAARRVPYHSIGACHVGKNDLFQVIDLGRFDDERMQAVR